MNYWPLEKTRFLVTCEHSSSFVPERERSWFQAPASVLKSHRGWDMGAAQVAETLAKKLNADLVHGRHTRLICDLNRTADHKDLFSEYSKNLSSTEKQRLVKTYHEPHWKRVDKIVSDSIKKGFRIVHLGVHSFTPVFDGYERPTDLGLLYDPSKDSEKSLARSWRTALQGLNSYQIHLNRPYRGDGNGLISDLRTLYPSKRYLGFEIELNQKRLRSSKEQNTWALCLSRSLLEVMGR